MEREEQNIEGMEPSGTVLLRYVGGIATDVEKAEVERWLENGGENEETLTAVARIYHQQRRSERVSFRDTMAAFGCVQQRLRKHTLKLWLRRTASVAACLVGALILSIVIINKREHSEIGEAQIVTVQANAGMRTSFNLPDGTVAYLNSGSSLSYPLSFDSGERCVSLVGEAYFKVTHNSEQPFVVSVSDAKMRVRVLGTEFNLQAYSGESNVQTTLVEGSVCLEFKDKAGVQHEQLLAPSEKASYDLLAGKIEIQHVNTLYDTAWKDGRLMFKNAPLPGVLKKLSYYYNVTFEIKDPVIESYCFTGTFENRQLSQVLDYLKISSNVDYRINQATADDSHGIKRSKVVLWKMK